MDLFVEKIQFPFWNILLDSSGSKSLSLSGGGGGQQIQTLWADLCCSALLYEFLSPQLSLWCVWVNGRGVCLSGKGVGWDAERGGLSFILNIKLCWPELGSRSPLFSSSFWNRTMTLLIICFTTIINNGGINTRKDI